MINKCDLFAVSVMLPPTLGLYHHYCNIIQAVEMLYKRHDISTRMDAITQCIAVQLDGPPHLCPSRKADRQVADSFCMLLLNGCGLHTAVHQAIIVTPANS